MLFLSRMYWESSLCDVLQAYLHSRDIIHRDLNSHNCLIKEVSNYTTADWVQRHHTTTVLRPFSTTESVSPSMCTLWLRSNISKQNWAKFGRGNGTELLWCSAHHTHQTVPWTNYQENWLNRNTSVLHTQAFYGSFSGTTRVSRCQKRTSGFYGAREE